MFKNEVIEKYYLVNKELNYKVIKIFNSIMELRNYLSNLLEDKYYRISRWRNDFSIRDLSITKKLTYKECYNTFFDKCKIEPSEEYPDGYRYIARIEKVIIPDKTFCILKNDGTVFNYTLLLDEIQLYKLNARQHNFGIGKTYKGDPYTPPQKRYIYYNTHNGFKKHYRSSSSLWQCVSKKELTVALGSSVDEIYNNCIDEGYDLDYDMLKKAVNLRYERKKAATSIRHPSGKGYGTPVSWKEGKCPHQWKEKR